MPNLTKEQVAKALQSTPKQAMEGAWGFKPMFTPAEMLSLGVFGRNYFRGSHSDPSDLLQLDADTFLLADSDMGSLGRNSWVGNCFGVKAGMDYKFWKEKGLIFDEDPLGWFHWYCRYYAGRRHPRDNHQIARWQNFKRWLHNGKNQYAREGKVSAVVLQSLLQWAYNPLDCFDDEHKADNQRAARNF
jgi:hypothetical protein